MQSVLLSCPCINQELRQGEQFVKSYWKGTKIYRFSRYITQNCLRRQPVANIFEEFEAPSKNFLATPLLCIDIGKIPPYLQANPYWIKVKNIISLIFISTIIK